MDGKSDNETLGVITRALRPSKKSDFEYIIASELAAGILSSDPLLKIRHVLEAFLTLDEEQKSQVASEDEIETYQKLYTITISLLNIQIMKNYMYGWETLVIPWGDRDPSLYALSMGLEKPDGWSEEEWQQYIFDLYMKTRYPELHPADVLRVKSTFITRTMPLIADLSRKMLETFVSQEVWEKTIEGLGGKRQVVKAETSPVQD